MEPMSPRGRALLEIYRRESAPTPETLERARRAIALRLQSAPAPTQKPAAHRPGGAPLRPRRWWAWACGGAMVALGGLSLQHTPQPSARPSASQREPAALPAPLAGPLTIAQPQLPPVTSSAREPSIAAARPVPSEAAPSPASAPRRSPLKRTIRSGEVARSTAPLTRSAAHGEPQRTDRTAARSADRAELSAPDFDSAPSLDVRDGEVESDPSSHDQSAAKVTHMVRTTAPPADASTLDAEVMQLRSAFDLLRGGEPLRALSALGEHARRFPAGKLHELAEVARVLALCDLDRAEAARAAAAAFLAAHPKSIHTTRVRSVCRAER